MPSQAEDEPDPRFLNLSTKGFSPYLANNLRHRKHWGYINRAGKFVIAPQYDRVMSFEKGTSVVGKSEMIWDLDRWGKSTSAKRSFNDFSRQRDERRWAKEAKEKAERAASCYKGDIYDDTGNTFIAHAQDVELSPFSEGLATCKIPEKLVPLFNCQTLEGTAIPSEHGFLASTSEADRLINRYGYINEKGHMVIPPRFYLAHDFKDGVAQVDIWNSSLQPNAQKSGYINKAGQVIGEKFFSVAWEFANGFGIIDKEKTSGTGDEWGFIDKTGRQIMAGYVQVNNFAEGIAGVKLANGKWGFINPDGVMVVRPQFDIVDYRSGDGLICVKRGNLYGYMDRTGNLTIPCKFADGGVFSEGLAAAAIEAPEREKMRLLNANIDVHCGFISRTGQQAIPPKFVGARHFSEGLCAVEDGLHWGFIDARGHYAIKPLFDDAQPFSEGLAAVLKNDHWGFIDRSGNYKIPPVFPAHDRSEERVHVPQQFSEGRAVVFFPDENWHFINRKGIKAFQTGCASASDMNKPFSQGLAVIEGPKYGDVGFVDREGKLKIPNKFLEAESFSEGLAAVSYSPKPMKTMQIPAPFALPDKTPEFLPDKIGYIDTSGNFRIDPQYDHSGPFKDGLARISIDSKSPPKPQRRKLAAGVYTIEQPMNWQFIDKTGRPIWSQKFYDARDFSQGRAAVRVGQKWGFIDKRGHFQVTPKYDSALDYSEGLAAVKRSGKWGFVSKSGSIAIRTQYWRCGSFSNGRALVLVPGRRPPMSINSAWQPPEIDFGAFWKFNQRGVDYSAWEGHN